jgi:hypothetical protein
MNPDPKTASQSTRVFSVLDPRQHETRYDYYGPSEGAGIAEIEQAWPGRRLPGQLIDAWTTARQARLFEDVDYGQWGLVLLSPAASAERTGKELRSRPKDYQPDDLVIGEFLGDQELLVLAGGADRGDKVLIALPLDDRADWIVAAEDLGQFLEAY